MCGLAALYACGPTAAPVTEAELLAIRDHMVPRGPDGAWARDGWAQMVHDRFVG